MKSVKESLRKTSTLRRGIRYSTFVITGHLFDTQFFNQFINILEKYQVEFRIIEWEVGNTSEANSTVSV